MENYIESRIVLGMLCLIHLFVNYGATAVRGHINKTALNTIIVAELLIVSAFIVYDNILAPPHNGWGAAIIGYLFVYGLIAMTRVIFDINTLLDENEAYEMTIYATVKCWHRKYFQGFVMKDERKIQVLLPYAEELVPKSEAEKKKKVKFDSVLKGVHIIVKLA